MENEMEVGPESYKVSFDLMGGGDSVGKVES
jgi:hypothetical protein